MVDLEFSRKHDQRFSKHFTAQMDDITLILKCHLMLEEMLRDFCSEMVPRPQFMKDSRFTFAQILDLARALYPVDIKLGKMDDMWALCEKLNRIRNMMAHALDPDSLKLAGHKSAIIESIRSRGDGGNSSFEFDECLTYILGALGFILQAGVTQHKGESILDIPRK